MKHALLLIISALMLVSCDLLKFHPYQELDSYRSGLTASNSLLLERLCNGRDTLRFAFISDLQRHYDDTRQCVSYINNHPDIDFTLIGGDLTDFGATDEYRWIADELCCLARPWLAIIGNHDFLGLGEHNYQQLFGPFNFSVNVGHLHIVCLNTIWRDSESSVQAPDLDFILDDVTAVSALNALRPDSLTHTVVMMHCMPGDEQFDDTHTPQFTALLARYPGFRPDDAIISTDPTLPASIPQEEQSLLVGTHRNGFCIKGHTHHHTLSRPTSDGTVYFCVDDIHKRELLLFTIHPQGYYYESIRF